MFGSNPGPDADLMMTLIVRQSFSNNLFGFGAAASTLLMFVMLVWVRRLVPRLPPRPGGRRMTARAPLAPPPRRRSAGASRSTRSPGRSCVVMVAPVVWLLLSALQTNLQIANGTYDFLSPDVRRVTRACGRRSSSSATS